MKAYILPLILFSLIISSCDLIDKIKEEDNPTGISGDQSPMGQVGTTVTSSSGAIAGVSNIQASVTTLSGGVSTYTGTATITNSAIKNALSNYPGVTVNGNSVTITGIKFKSTKEGIESVYGLDPGIIVKYNSAVGDKYPISGTSKTREVTEKSSSDDFYWGGMLIKTIKVEENVSKNGIKKITYWGNHKWGLVSVKFEFEDGSTAQFPVYNSTNN